MLTAVQIIIEKFVGHRFYRVGKLNSKGLQYCRNSIMLRSGALSRHNFKTKLHFVENPDLCF